MTSKLDRKERRDQFKPFFNGKDGPNIDGYHKVVIKRADGRFPGGECIAAIAWCIENIGKADDWESERRWFTAGVAFYFTEQEDRVMFNLVFS